tara:strand:- start:1229 stop:2038 length:810 start_codon:yes stop_codon:yes gene_type:complete
MKKNVIWWPAIINPNHKEKYGGFGYFEYSRKAWEYWCKENDCILVEFTEPFEKDLSRINPNWQKALFVFDELEKRNIEYDQIALVDSTAIPHWNCPNFFELTNRKFTAWRDMDNMKWIYDSIVGYEDLFQQAYDSPMFKLDQSKYINSGFMIFNETHKEFFDNLKQFYYDYQDIIIDHQENRVKKGNDQTPINYLLQLHNIELNLDLPVAYNLTHLHRREMFSYNWQLNEDRTPFFLKYGYVWRFNGIPKDQRTNLMGQIWNDIGGNYV